MAIGKVAKKFALYPPKKMMRKLGLEEGRGVRYEEENGRLVVEPLLDPIDVAMMSKKWSRTSFREFEAESEREQEELHD